MNNNLMVMCVCEYDHVCVSMYVCEHVCVSVCVWACVCEHVCVSMYVCEHVFEHVCFRTYVSSSVNLCLQKCSMFHIPCSQLLFHVSLTSAARSEDRH